MSRGLPSVRLPLHRAQLADRLTARAMSVLVRHGASLAPTD